jgi:hypothetical protein
MTPVENGARKLPLSRAGVPSRISAPACFRRWGMVDRNSVSQAETNLSFSYKPTTLRTKTLMIIGMTLAGFVGALYVVSRIVLLESFDNLRRAGYLAQS